jgi:mannose/fructose/N-acetylgalactosamine-specific phosphotransferase system component IIB
MTGSLNKDTTPWSIRYRDSADHVARALTPEDAIATACRLIEEGFDVYAIDCGQMKEFMGKSQLVRIHDIRTRKSLAFEQRPAQRAAFVFRAAGMPSRGRGSSR